MCIVLSDGIGGGGLRVPQVIEALLYSKSSRKALIYLDVMVANANRDSTLLVLHPGLVSREDSCKSSLVYDSPDGCQPSPPEHSPDLVLRSVYRNRLRKATADSRPEFHERKNCFLLGDTGKTAIDAWLMPEIAVCDPGGPRPQPNQVPAFTCFKVERLPMGISWFRFVLRLENASYAYLVGDHSRFWVDGPDHVKSLVRKELIARGDAARRPLAFFEDAFAESRLVSPTAYDIVVFKPGTAGVDTKVLCQPASADVYENTNHPETERAHLFVTRSPKFWIDLQFEEPARDTIRRSQPHMPVAVHT